MWTRVANATTLWLRASGIVTRGGPWRKATVANLDVPQQEPDKPAPVGLLSRIRARLTPVGGALASIAAVGAVAGGLVGYWNVWKTVRTDVLQEGQKTQREASGSARHCSSLVSCRPAICEPQQ